MEVTLTPEQLQGLRLVKQAFPFRIIYGAVKDGEFRQGAVVTMHVPNRLARQGWAVFLVK